jgi:hypothetical protein
MSVSTDQSQRVWLIALWLYALAAGVDIAGHLFQDLRTGNQQIEFADVAVAFSAGLFWPLDAVAMALTGRAVALESVVQHIGDLSGELSRAVRFL